MRQLSGVDALHVLEETPGQHMHTIKLAIVGPRDGAPVPVEEIKAWARERLPRIPAMRWTVPRLNGKKEMVEDPSKSQEMQASSADILSKLFK